MRVVERERERKSERKDGLGGERGVNEAREVGGIERQGGL